MDELLELYCAVMLCVPAKRLDVANTAIPPEITPLPILFVPSKKFIVPVFPVATVAVKVTDCGKIEGLSEELSKILETLAVTVFELLGL